MSPPSPSTWIVDSNLTWIQRIAVNIIKSGPVPNHVAFIMDGNRRFAEKLHIAKAEGHAKGFERLSETLRWCLDIGINEVTVYAFSIENFKRSQDEVDTLMGLARDKFARLLEERDKLNEKGICIRFVGNWSLLPIDLQELMAEAMLITRNNSKAILNVAFAYTSRDEITAAVRTVVAGVKKGELESTDVTETLIEKCFYTRKSSDVDLLVRTSGELRFSDFLLWQTSSTAVYFTKALWPEFNIWHLLGAVLYYQRCYVQMQLVKNLLHERNYSSSSLGGHLPRVQKFLQAHEEKETKHLAELKAKRFL